MKKALKKLYFITTISALCITSNADSSAILVEVINDRFSKNTYGNGDITITDTINNRMWLYDADFAGQGSYDSAVSYCQNLNYAGYDDWKLPGQSIIIESCTRMNLYPT